jgi:dihydroxy-acid dehydratase
MAGTLDLMISDELLETRKANPVAVPLLPAERGYARLHAEQVTQAEEGCDFRFLKG